MSDILNLPVSELELSTRAFHCLRYANIETIAQLVEYSSQYLLKLPNFGRRSLKEVEDALAKYGLFLADKALSKATPRAERSLQLMLISARENYKAAEGTIDKLRKELSASRTQQNRLHRQINDLRGELAVSVVRLDRISPRVQAVHAAHRAEQKLRIEAHKVIAEQGARLAELEETQATARQDGWLDGFRDARDLCLQVVEDQCGVDVANSIKRYVWPPVDLDRSKPFAEVFGEHRFIIQRGEYYRTDGVQVIWDGESANPEVVLTQKGKWD